MEKRDDGEEEGNANLCVAMRTFLGLLLPPKGEDREGKTSEAEKEEKEEGYTWRESSPGFLSPVSAIIPTSTIISA